MLRSDLTGTAEQLPSKSFTLCTLPPPPPSLPILSVDGTCDGNYICLIFYFIENSPPPAFHPFSTSPIWAHHHPQKDHGHFTPAARQPRSILENSRRMPPSHPSLVYTCPPIETISICHRAPAYKTLHHRRARWAETSERPGRTESIITKSGAGTRWSE